MLKENFHIVSGEGETNMNGIDYIVVGSCGNVENEGDSREGLNDGKGGEFG